MAQENEVIEYNVGDKVIITDTGSNGNWNRRKALFVGQVFTIKHSYPQTRYGQVIGYSVEFEENPIDSENDKFLHTWTWQSHNGHFKHHKPKRGVKVEPPKRKLIFSESFKQFLQENYNASRIARLIVACLNFESEKLGSLVSHILTGEDVSYLTYRSDGTISYLPKGKEHKVTEDGKWAQAGRQHGKPAKVMRKIFSKTALKLFKEADFEIFNNKFRSKFSTDGYEFKILSNVEIPDAYNADREEGEGGSLNNSCMRDQGEYMGIYAACPDVQMVVMLNKETGEQAGRALLWNATIEGTDTKIKFLDRFYVCKEMFYDAFVNYAIDNKLWYKKNHKTYDHKTLLYNPATEEFEDVKMVIKTKTDFESYPYIDTFTYGEDGELRNWNEDDKYKYYYTDTDGGRGVRMPDEIRGGYIEDEDDVIEVTAGEYAGRITHQGNTTDINDDIYYVNDPLLVETKGMGYQLRSECYKCYNWYFHRSQVVKCGKTSRGDCFIDKD